ncbi:hypothetical protein PGT21_013431 [Puccinia graminis f. sp. tritici]|uniref:Uncharacterized protein n=1 Tax=Puccinia graminis f. sp. tritici TaxID=56615 RepID=A0A5B0R162_PUCGR|nr:hypothetical protein PGT21_013431 [Puccinia graminis f. sp. tritici]
MDLIFGRKANVTPLVQYESQGGVDLYGADNNRKNNPESPSPETFLLGLSETDHLANQGDSSELPDTDVLIHSWANINSLSVSSKKSPTLAASGTASPGILTNNQTLNNSAHLPDSDLETLQMIIDKEETVPNNVSQPN